MISSLFSAAVMRRSWNCPMSHMVGGARQWVRIYDLKFSSMAVPFTTVFLSENDGHEHDDQ